MLKYRTLRCVSLEFENRHKEMAKRHYLTDVQESVALRKFSLTELRLRDTLLNVGNEPPTPPLKP